MLELKTRKTSALGQNSSHLNRLRIKPFFLPFVTRISETLSTANHDQLEPYHQVNRHLVTVVNILGQLPTASGLVEGLRPKAYSRRPKRISQLDAKFWVIRVASGGRINFWEVQETLLESVSITRFKIESILHVNNSKIRVIPMLYNSPLLLRR